MGENITDEVHGYITKKKEVLHTKFQTGRRREFVKLEYACPLAMKTIGSGIKILDVANTQRVFGCPYIRRAYTASKKQRADLKATTFPKCSLVGTIIGEVEDYEELKGQVSKLEKAGIHRELELDYLGRVALELLILNRILERIIYKNVDIHSKRSTILHEIKTRKKLGKLDEEVRVEYEEILKHLEAEHGKDKAHKALLGVLDELEEAMQSGLELKEPQIKRGLRAEGKYAMQSLAYVCPHALFTLSTFESMMGLGHLRGQQFEIRRERHQMDIPLKNLIAQNRCHDLMENKETSNEFWGVDGKNMLNLFGEFIETGDKEALELIRKGMDNFVTVFYMEILAILFRLYADEFSKKKKIDKKDVLKRCNLIEAVSAFHQLALVAIYADKSEERLEAMSFEEEKDTELKEKLVSGFKALADYKVLTAKLQENRLTKMAEKVGARQIKELNEQDAAKPPEEQTRAPSALPTSKQAEAPAPEPVLETPPELPSASSEPAEA